MCTARSVSRSCAWSFGLLFVRFLARGCFVLLAWFCSRSLAGPGLAVRFLWFSAGSATGFSVAGFPLRASLLVVLFGHWPSPRPLAISSRGWTCCASSRSLVRLGLGSLSPPALLSVLPVGFVLRCYSPDPAEPEGKERDRLRQGPR